MSYRLTLPHGGAWNMSAQSAMGVLKTAGVRTPETSLFLAERDGRWKHRRSGIAVHLNEALT